MITTSAAIPVLADDAEDTAGEAVVEVLDVEEEVEGEVVEEETVEEDTVELFTSSSLPDAVDGTITLTEDITLTAQYTFDSDVTIDLNGHTISNTTTYNAAKSIRSAFIVPSGVTVTVTDNSEDKNGKMTTSTLPEIFKVNGSLVLNSGTLEVYNTSVSTTVYGVRLYSNASFEMNGGTVSMYSSKGNVYGVYAGCDSTAGSEGSTATINGGTINVESATTSASYKAAGVYCQGSTLEITDVTMNVISSSSATKEIYGIYATSQYSDTDGSGVTVSGGTITVDAKTSGDAMGVYVKSTTDVEISGGTIDVDAQSGQTADGVYVVANGGTVAISGDDTEITAAGNAIYVSSNTSGTAGSTINVTGGTLTSESGSAIAVGDDATSAIVVAGGTLVSAEGNDNIAIADSADVTSATVSESTNTSTDNTGTDFTPTDGASVTVSGSGVNEAALAQAQSSDDLSGVSSYTINRTDTVTYESYTTDEDSEGDTAETLTMEIEPMVSYTYTDGAEKTTSSEKLDTTGYAATVTIPLGSAFSGETTVNVQHIYEDADGNKQNEFFTEVSVDATSNTVTVETYNGFSTWVIYTTNSNSIPSEIQVQLEATSDASVYNIKLVSSDGTEINRFTSAQLQFSLTETTGSIGYTIKAGDAINLVESDDGVYEFNVDGKTLLSAVDDTIVAGSTDDGVISDITSNEIVIGQVLFGGYGTFDFSVVQTYTDAQVHATSATNNLVVTYTVGGDYNLKVDDSEKGTETDGDAILEDITLTQETKTLTINVMFPNSVESHGNAYTAMKIYLTQSDGTETTYSLGTNMTYTDADGNEQTSLAQTEIDTTNDYYGYSFTIALPKNLRHSFEFVGDGYRTYRTSVLLEDDATLTVWNNAMSNDTAVVTVGSTDVTTDKVTFLAGDIVLNNKIDLWDLSAVVSYFGKSDIGGSNWVYDETYVKYDLNRDGKVDSRDIAMVLVSWNY
ncbi:MAG: hypothetical protein LUF26_07145, partial [Firmicutes bacterium]|nr:hypothetical protein [Bacillota bacterium]